MANLIKLQNGKTKVARGRHGGHGKTYHSDKVYGRLTRQRKLEEVLLADLLRAVNDGANSALPSDAPVAVNLCPISGEPKPADGEVSFFSDDCYHTLVYRDDKLTSAHSQYIGEIAHSSLVNLVPRSPRRRR